MPADIAMANPDGDIVYSISRHDNGRQVTIDAEEATHMRPGDILRVGLRPRIAPPTVLGRINVQSSGIR